MTWVRIDTGFIRHPKRLALTLRQREIHLAAMCWAGEQYTGGRIPESALGALGATRSDAARMVAVGLWDAVPGGWAIHDWEVYNDDAERGKEIRDAAAERRRRWRAEKRRQRETGQSTGHVRGQTEDMSADMSADKRQDKTAGQSSGQSSPRARAGAPRAAPACAESRPVPSRPVPPVRDGTGEGAATAPAPMAQSPPPDRDESAELMSAEEAARRGLVGANLSRVLARRGGGAAP